jgi:adenylyl-sulfate kinase
MTLWLTGLPCSGKTTLGQALVARLLAAGRNAELLDGDVLRRDRWKDLGFTQRDREENVRRIGRLAEEQASQGIVAVVSAVSPYRAIRDEVRRGSSRFVEVYVNAPLAVCERRDVKGMYRRARLGELKGFTGIDDPYEPPVAPEVECRTDLETIEESVEKILRACGAASAACGQN